jgi:hypothetical protein
VDFTLTNLDTKEPVMMKKKIDEIKTAAKKTKDRFKVG